MNSKVVYIHCIRILMWYVCLTVATHMNARLYCLLHTYEMLSSQQLQDAVCVYVVVFRLVVGEKLRICSR